MKTLLTDGEFPMNGDRELGTKDFDICKVVSKCFDTIQALLKELDTINKEKDILTKEKEWLITHLIEVHDGCSGNKSCTAIPEDSVCAECWRTYLRQVATNGESNGR